MTPTRSLSCLLVAVLSVALVPVAARAADTGTVQPDAVEHGTVEPGSLRARAAEPGAMEPSAEPSVQVVGSLITIRPEQAVSGRASAWISAARNEFESFQVVISAGSDRLTGVRISLASPLTGSGGTIPGENVVIYREAYLDLKTPSDLEGGTGRWPDALVPSVDTFYGEQRNAFPVDVPAGENRVAWIDVLVPPGQAPGRYDGHLEVTGDGGFRASVPVGLKVREFKLPSTSRLRSAFGHYFESCPAHYDEDCFPNEEQGWALKSLYVRAALENRVTIDYSAFQPPVPYERAWFRQYILPLLQGRSPQNDEGEWLPVRLEGARLTSIQVDGGEYLDDWRQEALRGGFAERAFFYACDEPNRSAELWQQCKQRARDARERWPGLDVLITATLRDARDFGAAGLIDLLVPIVNAMHDKPGSGADEGNQRPGYDGFLGQPGNELWLYNACPSHSCTGDPGTDPYWAGWPSYVIDQPAFEHRAMGLASYRYRTSGELYFATDHDLRTAWTDQSSFGGNGDGTLFYPGTPAMIGGQHDIPVESMRLKRIRDGREDFEYLTMLGRRGEEAEARRIARELLPAMYLADVPQDELTVARADLARRIEAAAPN